MNEVERRAEIARLNDAFRHAGGGIIVLTAGIAALPIQTRDAILAAVRCCRHDGEDSEHHIGTLMTEGREVIWYILYHRRDPDPERDADPAAPATNRVLVVMLAGEP